MLVLDDFGESCKKNKIKKYYCCITFESLYVGSSVRYTETVTYATTVLATYYRKQTAKITVLFFVGDNL